MPSSFLARQKSAIRRGPVIQPIATRSSKNEWLRIGYRSRWDLGKGGLRYDRLAFHADAIATA